MRKSLFLAFLLLSSRLFALPEGAEVVAGRADISSPDSATLKIEASDKAILNYQKFNIKEQEHVQFLQPSSKSSVLNRVTGKYPSSILGKLSANGRVFLVNEQGIYIGPKATVNVGSFIASTLNIKDEDFLNDSYQFSLSQGAENSKIINEGTILAQEAGCIALFAPIIENRGQILAKAEKVFLGSGEKITLDFARDGLIQFSVDGELKHALIENYGKIASTEGFVQLSMKVAQNAIKMVLNTDGVQPATAIDDENGIIRLVDKSSICSRNIDLNGDKLSISGLLDASGEKGGLVRLAGRDIALLRSTIDASGDFGGGTTYIGGEYQGKGSMPTAQKTSMDKDSSILADAKIKGDGGKVILWSDETTLFNGKISAKGGKEGGNGGFVETSGKKALGCQTGKVDTISPSGKIGSWLLDPSSITVGIGGTGTLVDVANCSDTSSSVTIAVATINAATSDVVLCASSLIVVNDSHIDITTPGVSITFQGTGGIISTTFGGVPQCNTNGGDITFSNSRPSIPQVMPFNSNGGNITFSNGIVLGSYGGTVSLAAGTSGIVTITGSITDITSDGFGLVVSTAKEIHMNGSISLQTGTNNIVSFTTAPTAVSPSIHLAGTITTNGGTIIMSGPVVLENSIGFDTTFSGSSGLISFNGTTSTVNAATAGVQSLTINAGPSGTVIFEGAIGNGSALSGLSFTGTPALIKIGNNITLSGTGTLQFPGSVQFTGSSTITAPNINDINFSQNVNGTNGNEAITINAGSGQVRFTASGTGVGFGTVLGSFSASGTYVYFARGLKTNGAINCTANYISPNQSITTNGAPMTFTGTVVTNTSGTVTFDTTNGGISFQGANITFSDMIYAGCPENYIFNAGTAGIVTFVGAIKGTGGGGNLRSLTVSNAKEINQNGGVVVDWAGGSVSYITSPLALSPAIRLGGSIYTQGGAISLTGPVVLNNNVILDTTRGGASGAITFNGTTSTINAAVSGGQSLTLNRGPSGTFQFGGAIGNISPLASLNFSPPLTTWSVGNDITLAGPFTFAGTIQLTNSCSLGSLSTLSLADIEGNGNNVNLSGATVHLQKIGAVSNLNVNGGAIDFAGQITIGTGTFQSQTTIQNATSTAQVNATGNVAFNALNGNVGTSDSPIRVNIPAPTLPEVTLGTSVGQIYVGAGPLPLGIAYVNGVAIDNTIHDILSNPACIIIFNGTEIKNCKPALQFPMPGMDSSYFTLANDFFFLPLLFDSSYFPTPLVSFLPYEEEDLRPDYATLGEKRKKSHKQKLPAFARPENR